MRIGFSKTRLFASAAVAGMMALSGCTDNKYDFNEIDYTIGIGGSGLTLPVSSTDTIQLSDVLDIDDSECVVTLDNGDYVFTQSGGDVEPAHPMIDKISVTGNVTASEKVSFNSLLGAKRHARRVGETVSYEAEGELHALSYSGDKPDEVVDLTWAGTDAVFSLSLTFSDGLKSFAPSMDLLELHFPEYMELDDVKPAGGFTSCEVVGSDIIITGIDLSRDLVVRGSIVKLNFGKTGDLAIKGGKIVMDGIVSVKARLSKASGNHEGILNGDQNDLSISSEMSLDHFNIVKARGRFNPHIDLDDLGDSEISGVPDFLTDGRVVVDLYNPQILLTIGNDMNVEGFVSGTLTAYKNNARLAEISVPEMRIRAEQTSRICICRNKAALGAGASDYDEVVEVANLSDLIKTIPDRVSFNADARANSDYECEFDMGRQYNITPSYNIEAPIAFAKDARIVYTDSIDDMNDDIKDIELADNSYLQITAQIENRVPAYLTLSAEAFGMGGRALGKDKVEIETSNTIIASDGASSSGTPVTITVRQNSKGALKELDGIRFTIEADAAMDGNETVTGVTLNAKKHFIIARDLEIKLIGAVIADMN